MEAGSDATVAAHGAQRPRDHCANDGKLNANTGDKQPPASNSRIAAFAVTAGNVRLTFDP